MNLSQSVCDEKLQALQASEGFASLEEMLQAAIVDSVSPAICIACGYTAEMERDQDRGYCESCGQNTVVSALVLAGLI